MQLWQKTGDKHKCALRFKSKDMDELLVAMQKAKAENT